MCPTSHPEDLPPQIYQPFGKKKRITDLKGPSRGSLTGMLKEHYEGGSVNTAVYFFQMFNANIHSIWSSSWSNESKLFSFLCFFRFTFLSSCLDTASHNVIQAGLRLRLRPQPNKWWRTSTHINTTLSSSLAVSFSKDLCEVSELPKLNNHN